MSQENHVIHDDPGLLSLFNDVESRAARPTDPSEEGEEIPYFTCLIYDDTGAEQRFRKEVREVASEVLAPLERKYCLDDGWEEGGTLIGLGDRIRPPGVASDGEL